MDGWIRIIFFVLVMALWISVLSAALMEEKSFSGRIDLSMIQIGLILGAGIALLASLQAFIPTDIKLLGEDTEVAETHSLASLKTGSHLDGKTALSFGYLTERDEYVVMVRQDDGGYRRESYSADDTVVYEDADADGASVEIVNRYMVVRDIHWLPIVGEWSRDRREFSGQKARIHVPKGSIVQGEYDF